MKKKFINLAIAAALLSGSAVGHSATLNTGSADGTLADFGGFDWHANGASWIQGFGLTSNSNINDTTNFTLTYQAFAGVIDTTSPVQNLFVASPGSAFGTYEVTTYQTLNETATCLNVGCSSINITTNSGVWDIYLDNTPNANQAAGTGFLDGINILSGVWNVSNNSFTLNPDGTARGAAVLDGTVTYTNNAVVNPNLLGTQFQGTLLLPGLSNYTRPAEFNGISTGVDTPAIGDTPGHFVLQTDGSQSFTQQVPEPGMLALLGIGILGFGFARRTRT
ncbi:MAG: flocculation-associated PEP-CTERM protein PepA [Aureliella sp.]